MILLPLLLKYVIFTNWPSCVMIAHLSLFGMSYPMDVSIVGYLKYTSLTENESEPFAEQTKFSTFPSTTTAFIFACLSSVYRSLIFSKLIITKVAITKIQTIFATFEFELERVFFRMYTQYITITKLIIKKSVAPVENTRASQTFSI